MVGWYVLLWYKEGLEALEREVEALLKQLQDNTSGNLLAVEWLRVRVCSGFRSIVTLALKKNSGILFEFPSLFHVTELLKWRW